MKISAVKGGGKGDPFDHVSDEKFLRLWKAVKDCPKTLKELTEKSEKEQKKRDRDQKPGS